MSSPNVTAGDARTGRARLLALVTEAQRFHDARPHSARRKRSHSRRTSPNSSMSISDSSMSPDDASLAEEYASATGGVEPWEYLRSHVSHFWDTDGGEESGRYARGKQWLTSLQLWDASLSWKQVEQTAPEQSPDSVRERKVAVLRSLKPGQLFR